MRNKKITIKGKGKYEPKLRLIHFPDKLIVDVFEEEKPNKKRG